MIRLRALLPCLLVASLSGCVVPVVEPVYSTCRATSSGSWTASIYRVPRFRNGKPKQVMLAVSGTVNVPDGIEPSLELGPIEKFDVPTQQVLVRTEGAAAPGQPLVARQVQARFKPLRRFEAVRIRCGDGMFALIRPVPESQPPA